MRFGKTTPILRIFDEAKAREFHVDFLADCTPGAAVRIATSDLDAFRSATG